MIRSAYLSKLLLTVHIICSLLYFSWWFNLENISNPFLYFALFLGEVYHVFMVLMFCFTLWPKVARKRVRSDPEYQPTVDIYIPVAGEPLDVIRQTAIAAKNQDYQNHTVYILNDGFVAKKANWKEVEAMAKKLGVNCITRTVPGGAKAGNINNTLRQTDGEIIIIFDADMIAQPNFIQKVLPYFKDPRIGFVQTPQYYSNHGLNQVTAGAWEQQEFFFGPVMVGKDNYNSAFICGTNVAIRRQTLEEAGGMFEENIAEDFLTSLFIHKNGWKSVYIKEKLTEGLAPEDLLSYYKQQLRWARGSLEVLFNFNPILNRKLSWGQKFQYLSSGLYYLNGVVVFIDMLMPLLFLFFALQPVATTTTNFAIFFLPFMFFNMYSIYMASDRSITFRAMSFSQSSWVLQLQALFSIITKQKMGFAITSKKALEGNFLSLSMPHIIYIILLLIATATAIAREGLNPSVMTNIAWGIFNGLLFVPFIMASYNWSSLLERKKLRSLRFQTP